MEPTKPITCPCEEFDRDVSGLDLDVSVWCYCGHSYMQHSEESDGLPCTYSGPIERGGSDG